MADGGTWWRPEVNLSSSPVLCKFLDDHAFFRGVVGPVGSGKSTGMVCDILMIALSQPADIKDNIRYTRHAIIRNTTPELKSTTIKTWESILKPDLTGIEIRYSSPIRWLWIRPPVGNEPGIHCEVLFIALDKPKDVRKLLSLELTSAWFNEACEIPKALIDGMTTRVRRYPSINNAGGHQLAFIIADTNPPDDEENWFHQTMMFGDNGEDSDPLRWRFFQQPPAVLEVAPKGQGYESIEKGYLGFTFATSQVIEAAGSYWAINPGAENLRNLAGTDPDGRGGYLYYAQMLKNKRRDWIQRFAQGKQVYVQDGKPVIPEFVADHHVKKLNLIKDLDIQVGVDIGGGTLQPAAVFGQRHPRGAWLIHRELVLPDYGLKRFSEAFNSFVAQEFPGFNIKVAWCDPACLKRDEFYEVQVVDHLRAAGIPAQPAPTNDPKARREALAAPLGRFYDGRFGLMIDPACKMVVQGLSGKWRFRKLQIPGTENRYSEFAEKNKWSHPCEALEYLVSGGGEHIQLKTGNAPGSVSGWGGQTVVAGTDFNVH